MSMPAKLMVFIFQSTLSVRRATHVRAGLAHRLHISIHALRKESDRAYIQRLETQLKFQSTLSVRRATIRHDRDATRYIHFNPRSP